MKTVLQIVGILIALAALSPKCDGPQLHLQPIIKRPHLLPLRKPHPKGDVEAVRASVGGKVSPDGSEELQCDLPGQFHTRNSVGTDGSGLCVFDSLHLTGVYQNDPLFAAIFDFMKRYPGGGYPQKVTDMLERASKKLGIPVPEYVQVEANDLDLLKLATKNGLMVACTYSRSPTGRYNGRSIPHMVNVPHATDKWYAILDNNYIGENNYEWIPGDQQFLRSAAGGNGQLWFVILLTQSPPPNPYN